MPTTRIPSTKPASRNGSVHVDRSSSNGQNGSSFLDTTFTVETESGNIALKAGDILEVLLKHKEECDGKEGKPHPVVDGKPLPSLYLSVAVDHFKLKGLYGLGKVMDLFLKNNLFESSDSTKKFSKIRMTAKADEALGEWKGATSDSNTIESSRSKPVQLARAPGYGEVAVKKTVEGDEVKKEKTDWTTLVTDITALAKKEDSLKVVSRPKDLKGLKRELSRHLSHGIFLIGEDGIGKSSLVQELACEIVNNKAGSLNNHTVLRVSLSLPEFAEAMPEMYDFATQNPDVIFYFDDIDAVFTSDDEVQAKMLRQLGKFINNRKIKTVFEMTQPTSLRLFNTTPNWASKVNQIKIEEPDLETTLAIVKENLKVLEEDHEVDYKKEVDLKKTIGLCKNYITNAPFPKKVLDVLDIAGVVANQDDRKIVTMEDVSLALSEMTGLPLGIINEDERQKLLRLDEKLTERVLGQGEAIKKVSDAVRLKRRRLTNSEKGTTGVFMFLGPTGVGKTELAKALAEWVTGDEKNLVRLDMGEYMKDHNVSRLIGAPPGYVGYEEGGQLTNAAIKRPFGVVLLDEIEKADRAVFNILLPLFDEGRITDGQGRTADFKNYIIIMTSNLAAEEIEQILDTAKGAQGEKGKTTPDTQTQINTAVTTGLQFLFTPEQRNRIDEVIVFKELEEEIQRNIVRKKLDKYLSEVQNDSEIFVEPTDEAIDFLKDKLFERKSEVHDRQGGRKAEDVLKNHFKIPLTDFVLEEDIKAGAKLTAYYDLGSTSIKFEKAKKI